MTRTNAAGTTTRRGLLRGMAAGGGLIAASGAFPRFVQAQSAEPIRLGFQLHRTGIGAAYGRWYERTAKAALEVVNAGGGINGRPVEILFEDDGTDPKRGAEVMEKFATQLNCDAVFGALFSHVVVGTAPRAAELKMPYLVCSEGHHVASGATNRWTLQPGITDVKSQVQAMAPWITENLGKKVTMIYPDYAFGYDHRDSLTGALQAKGGEVVASIAIPPTETSFTRYFPQIPRETEVLYHVMVGPAVLTFVKELGEFYAGGDHPPLFGFIDSLEAVDINGPGLEFLAGSHFWEGQCRFLQDDAGPTETFYRGAVGVDAKGAAIEDAKNVSTYAHMFSAWETLFALKERMEAAEYQKRADGQKLVEAFEALAEMPLSNAHPQGPKIFNGRTHQAFGIQYISKFDGAKLTRVHTTTIEDGLYTDQVDYTTQSF